MEPVPPPRGPGRIIRLNGASNSGKPALATVLQDALDEPFLHVSSTGSWPRACCRRDVFVIGVHSDLDELDCRERARGDRRIGEGRTHVEVDGIHTPSARTT